MWEFDIGEFEHAQNRLPHRLYISKSFTYGGRETAYRFGWKRLEAGALKELVKESGELVLHETDTGIQQIKAKFVEDGRRITHLHIQRWNTRTGNPMGHQVVLYGEQITRLAEFLDSIRRLEIKGTGGFNANESDLHLVHLPDAAARKTLEEHPALVAEFARSRITTEDVVALAHPWAQTQRCVA